MRPSKLSGKIPIVAIFLADLNTADEVDADEVATAVDFFLPCIF